MSLASSGKIASRTLRDRLTRPDLLREAAYVAGKWHAATPNSQIEVRNPATGELVGHIPSLGEAETSVAVSSAQAAFPTWKSRTAQERAAVLRRWFDLMNQHADDLATLLTAEQGKPLAEARMEINYAAAFLEWFAEEGRRAYGETIPGPTSTRRVTVLRQPVGVVAAVTPWNFPVGMITRKVGPALAAGCTVVLKPSELTPFSALALAALGEEAGVPKGVFNVVTGLPGPIGNVLTGDPRIRKFTFTGSTAVGRMLAARCMDTVKRVSLELGGNAPFVVFEDADLDAAVEGALASKFRNSGQTCVCANRFIVHESICDEFAARLARRAGAMVVGDGLDKSTQQGPLINAAAIEKVRRHVEDALEQGAKLLTGGARHPAGPLFWAPTVLTDVPPTALLFRQEVFGPVASITRFSGEAEAIALANDTQAGLAAYVYTRDLSRAARVSEALEYGMVGLNAGLVSFVAAPFGGVKQSGLGYEGSRHGLDDYLELKAVFTEVSAA